MRQARRCTYRFPPSHFPQKNYKLPLDLTAAASYRLFQEVSVKEVVMGEVLVAMALAAPVGMLGGALICILVGILYAPIWIIRKVYKALPFVKAAERRRIAENWELMMRPLASGPCPYRHGKV